MTFKNLNPINTHKLFIVISSALWLCSSCNSENKSVADYAYFGGEIVNPNTDYVLLYRDFGKKDTIYLDKNNQFFHKLDNVKEGVYYFSHQPENQMAFIEKGDSILVRLNTLEFDESMVFTGRGAKKNNFLIDMFLQNELERKSLNKNKFNFSFSSFTKKQDSLLKLRNKVYDRFVKKNKPSSLAKNILKASYTFEFYTRNEMYLRNLGNHQTVDSVISIPQDFMAYRKKIDYNSPLHQRVFSYNRFLYNYIDNLAHNNVTGSDMTLNSPEIVITELKIIDSLIKNPYIKNRLLRGFTRRYLLHSKNSKNSKKALEVYLEKSTRKDYQKEIQNLALLTSRLQPNKLLPEQDLIDASGETVILSSLFKKPITVLFFWSTKSKNHFIKAHEKASELRSRYKDYDFIGINTDTDKNQTKNWLNTIKRYGYEPIYEYEFKYPKCSSKELIINYINKVIIVDAEGKIIDANADLFSTNILENILPN